MQYSRHVYLDKHEFAVDIIHCDMTRSTVMIDDIMIIQFHYYAFSKYRQVSNISRTLWGNKIGDHSDIVGASPVGAAITTSSFST